MARTLFSIGEMQEPAGWEQAHLVMEISPHAFSYACLNPEKKPMYFRFYALEAQDDQERTAELGHIIGSDEMLQHKTARKTFLYNFPESHLVPGEYFTAGAGRDWLELLHGDLRKGIVLEERIQGRDQYNVYQVPAEIHGLLQRSFTNSKYWHYYSIWMQEGQVQPASLSALFYPSRMLVAVLTEEGQVLLVQSYTYEAAEDVAYYLLNICQQLQLSPDTLPLVLSGMIDASSALYTEIYKYFRQVSMDAFPGAPAIEEYPAHFFSPLLKLAVCVS